MVHKFSRAATSLDWRCGFCDRGFDNMYARDSHEVHCPKRDGKTHTSEGRRVGTAW
jgi:hypothetical protein